MIMCNSTSFKIKTFIDNFTEPLQLHPLGPVAFYGTGKYVEMMWKCMHWQKGDRMHYTQNSFHGVPWWIVKVTIKQT
jgi:hypothetical protein